MHTVPTSDDGDGTSNAVVPYEGGENSNNNSQNRGDPGKTAEGTGENNIKPTENGQEGTEMNEKKPGKSLGPEDPWILIENAGTEEANGRYVPNGIRDGIPKYVRKYKGKTYEVSRVPTRQNSKNWWISRTDCSPDIDYYTYR
eukprot:UN01046